ncbi:MAG: recombinase family protein [Bacteroidetes bacterium]|nr:recombinase family protein [Bacteroidota bacterium]
MEPTKSIGIWIRVSTEDQAKGDSPEHHEKRARLYAEAKGWEVTETYHLEAVSGKSVMDNSEAKRMLSDIRKGRISGLIFSKLARLARNTKELLEFADIFRDHNADLISISESIDTSTPAGRLFYTMIAAMAQWEREEISSRIAASVPIRAKLGKHTGGYACLGYQWDENKKLVVIESEAPVVKLIFELFLKHKRKEAVARMLNQMGHRTRTGGTFNDSGVARLLRNPTLKGMHLANYTTHPGGGGAVVIKPESDWVFTSCPAIVTPELWDECNRILEEQTEKRKKPGPRAVHLLSGYVTCSCGQKMYVFHRDLNYRCKICQRRIHVSDIDEIYHEQLKGFLLTEVDPKSFLQKSESIIAEKEKLLAGITEESKKIRKQASELVTMRMNNEVTKDSFKEHHAPLEERLQQLNERIPELEAEISFLRVQAESTETVMTDAKTLYANWPLMNLEERRSIVERITEAVIIDKEDITIRLCYAPAILRNTGNSQPLLK